MSIFSHQVFVAPRRETLLLPPRTLRILRQRSSRSYAASQSGAAMIVVLWVLVLMTIMAVSFSSSMRRETSLVRNAKQRAQATALAEAGVHYAMLRLLQPNLEHRWRADGSLYELSLSGARVRVKIFDEIGKIDINQANSELLLSLMRRVGLEEEKSSRVVDGILDWRDGDDLLHANGAEKDEYEDAGLQYGPRNKPFRDIQELRLVLEISEPIYTALEPMITVNNREEGINPKLASRDVLMSLPNVDEEAVDNYLQARLESTENNSPVPEFPFQTSVPVAEGGAFTYTIRAEAQLQEGATGSLAALVRQQTSLYGLPFTVLEWRRVFSGKKSLFTEQPATKKS